MSQSPQNRGGVLGSREYFFLGSATMEFGVYRMGFGDAIWLGWVYQDIYIGWLAGIPIGFGRFTGVYRMFFGVAVGLGGGLYGGL